MTMHGHPQKNETTSAIAPKFNAIIWSNGAANTAIKPGTNGTAAIPPDINKRRLKSAVIAFESIISAGASDATMPHPEIAPRFREGGRYFFAACSISLASTSLVGKPSAA